MTKLGDQVLIISPLHKDTINFYKDILIHLPHLESEHPNIEVWKQTIDKYKPRIIVFGGGAVNADMLKYWHSVSKTDLYLIRRGVTLVRCDVTLANELGIKVFNTPGVNAPYVAKYACDNLFSDGTIGNCAVLGVGKIGEIVAKRAISAQCNLKLFSRQLSNITTRENKLSELSLLNNDKVICVDNVIEAFTDSSLIAITLPLTDDTRGIITEKAIEAIPPYAKLVSISFPEMFTDEALRALHDREDIDVIFDHLEESFPKIIDKIGVKIL